MISPRIFTWQPHVKDIKEESNLTFLVLDNDTGSVKQLDVKQLKEILGIKK